MNLEQQAKDLAKEAISRGIVNEGDYKTLNDQMIQASIAISLKRIADYLAPKEIDTRTINDK
jgi:hypothetical protein